MNHPSAGLRLPFVLLLAALLGVACDDEGPTEAGADLTGTYTLESITFEGQPTLSPPAATGTLTLTDTRYEVSIDIQSPAGVQEVRDAGTYTVEGNSWTQESDDGSLQSVGTFELEGDVLTVDVTTQGQRVVNVWRRS